MIQPALPGMAGIHRQQALAVGIVLQAHHCRVLDEQGLLVLGERSSAFPCVVEADAALNRDAEHGCLASPEVKDLPLSVAYPQ